jgi:hypothetical protein
MLLPVCGLGWWLLGFPPGGRSSSGVKRPEKGDRGWWLSRAWSDSIPA